ncbi:MAG: carboxypeptidase regulatory-like domain-containing protein [Planctomycetales bacterium]
MRIARGALLAGCVGMLGWGTMSYAAETGTISGQIVLDGDVPEMPPLVKKGDATAKDPAVCAAADVPDDALVVNPKNKGIANVFVFLGKAPKDMPAALKKSKDKEVVFDQKGCRFLPHALMVRTDQTVLVKSSDSVSHNTHTFPLRNSATNTTINPNDQTGVPFKMPSMERVPVQVKCDIHPWMKAYWLVLDHPYGAVTDEDGKFKIEGLPEGKHEFMIWQEKPGFINRKYEVTVKAGDNELEPVKVPVSKLK